MANSLVPSGIAGPGDSDKPTQDVPDKWCDLKALIDARIIAGANESQPKYRALYWGLVDAIKNGTAPAQSKLPTESQLTDLTPFSLGTVQHALTSLADNGFVVRKPGVGSVVVPWNHRLNRPLHARFMHEDGSILPIFSHVLERTVVDGPGPWLEALKDPEQVIRIDRHIEVEWKFSIFNRFYVDGAHYPLFRDRSLEDLNGANFKLLMVQEYNLPITQVEHRLAMIEAPPEAAEIIGIEAGALCLRVRARAYCGNQNSIYYQDFFIPPTSQELIIDSRLKPLAEI